MKCCDHKERHATALRLAQSFSDDADKLRHLLGLALITLRYAYHQHGTGSPNLIDVIADHLTGDIL